MGKIATASAELAPEALVRISVGLMLGTFWREHVRTSLGGFCENHYPAGFDRARSESRQLAKVAVAAL